VVRLSAAAAVFVPALALACPMCAERVDGNRLITYGLIAALLAVPYTLGAVIVRTVKKMAASEEKSLTPHPENDR
jgi:hypothetical protein